MTDLLALIDAELATLQQARALIAATGKRKPGRPTKATPAPTAKPKQKRTMSPEARQRIAEAQRKRWPAHKKFAK